VVGQALSILWPARLLLVITTATLRDATAWDEFVDHLGLAGPVRHGLHRRPWRVPFECVLTLESATIPDPAVTTWEPEHVGEFFERWAAKTTIISPAKFNVVAAEIMRLLASAVTAYNQHKARRL
jgi:hypothetical protein